MIQTAQMLRQVRRAQIEFLLRWAGSEAAHAAAPAGNRFAELDPIDNPDNHDWHLLYGGSVLDD